MTTPHPQPHPEPHSPASVFGTIDGQPIDVCLPFNLVDSDDEGSARMLAGTELEISPDVLVMILFAASRPGELGTAPAHDAIRWGLIADAFLVAGAMALTRDYQRMREAADRHPDPDALLWWESCREQVRHLFEGRPLDATRLTDQPSTDQASTDQASTDETAEEA